MSSLLALLSFPFLAVTPKAAPSASTAGADSSEVTAVVVQNDRPTPVTVYAENAFGDFKLGVVAPMTTQTLRVPDLAVGDGAVIDFFVAPKRGAEQDSGYLELQPGDRVGLIVPTK